MVSLAGDHRGQGLWNRNLRELRKLVPMPAVTCSGKVGHLRSVLES